MSATKDQRVNLRINESDRALFDRAASERSQTLTQFLVESGRERAERLLADRRNFAIGDEDWQALMDAMDRPAKANPRLVDLFSRSKPE